jgi:hypothetical protein
LPQSPIRFLCAVVKKKKKLLSWGAEPGANSPCPACARLPRLESPCLALGLTCGSHACSFLPSSASSPRQSNPHLCATSAAAAAARATNERTSETEASAAAAAPGSSCPHPPRSPSPGSGSPRVRGLQGGGGRGSGGDDLLPGRAPPGRRPRARYLSLRARGGAEKGEGSERGRAGRARAQAGTRLHGSSESSGWGGRIVEYREEEGAAAATNGKPARLHLSGRESLAAVHTHTHTHTHTHARARARARQPLDCSPLLWLRRSPGARCGLRVASGASRARGGVAWRWLYI